jgi:predicted SprT family Zn-dependent metalloprotease
LDVDYLPLLQSNLPDNLKIYVAPLQSLNPYKLGWRTQFGSSREWAGLCSYRAVKGISAKQKDLFLSIQFTKWDKNWRDNVDNVILHEIAHAIVNEVFLLPLGGLFNSFDPLHEATQGHGMTWDAVCRAINKDGDCDRYYRNKDLKADFKFFKYQCGYCGDTKFSNSKSFATNCFRCFKPVIVQKNK